MALETAARATYKNSRTHLRVVSCIATCPLDLAVVEDCERTIAIGGQRDLKRVALQTKTNKTNEHQAIANTFSSCE